MRVFEEEQKMGKIIFDDYNFVEYKEIKSENELQRHFLCKIYTHDLIHDKYKNISEDFCKFADCVYLEESAFVMLEYEELGLPEFDENYDIEHILFNIFAAYKCGIEKGEIIYFGKDRFVYNKLEKIKKDSTYTINLEEKTDLNNDEIYDKILNLFGEDYERLYSYIVLKHKVPSLFISKPYSITFYK